MSTAINRATGERQWFILYVLICLEIGIFLALVPWSAIWERNYFLEAYPSFRALMLNSAFRGAVAGLGLANIYLGLREILHRHRSASEAGPPARREASGKDYESTNGDRASRESDRESRTTTAADSQRMLASSDERR